MTVVAAVDLGATSGRIARVDLETRDVDVVHRFANAPIRDAGGGLRWDWESIVDQTRLGLSAALERGPLASIGIDTWGVDYGLITTTGELVAPPFSYRDDRTRTWRELARRVGAERLYRTTGIQLMAINTIFQLAVHDRDELARAHRVLMLPELMVHALAGTQFGETTSAGTSQLVDLATADWSDELVDAAGIRRELLPAIAPATTPAGAWRGVPVHLVGGHDTASVGARCHTLD